MKVADAISFAKMFFKVNYNKKPKIIGLQEESFAMLCLYQGFKILLSQILGPKLLQQFADLFQIISKVGHLAYNLKILTH